MPVPPPSDNDLHSLSSRIHPLKRCQSNALMQKRVLPYTFSHLRMFGPRYGWARNTEWMESQLAAQYEVMLPTCEKTLVGS